MLVSSICEVGAFPPVDIEQLIPGDMTIPLKARVLEPAAKRPVMPEPLRHLLRTFVLRLVAFAPVSVATVEVAAVGVAAAAV